MLEKSELLEVMVNLDVHLKNCTKYDVSLNDCICSYMSYDELLEMLNCFCNEWLYMSAEEFLDAC